MGFRRDNEENGVKDDEQRVFDRRQGLPFPARRDKRDGFEHKEDAERMKNGHIVPHQEAGAAVPIIVCQISSNSGTITR